MRSYDKVQPGFMGIHLLLGAGACALALALTLSIVQPFSFIGSRSQRLPFQLLMNNDERIEAFYTSRAWRRCRKSFLASKGGLCEICAQKGLIEPASQVHHKTHITPDNVDNPAVTLNYANLMALCENCHSEMHHPRRWRCDPDGHVQL